MNGAGSAVTAIDDLLEDEGMEFRQKRIDTTRSSTTMNSEEQFQNEPSDSEEREMAPIANRPRKSLEGRASRSPVPYFGRSIAAALGIDDEIEV